MEFTQVIFIRVAAVQMKVTRNTDKNLQRILYFIDKAKAKRSDIACFPETCLVSDEKNIPKTEKYLKAIQEMCRKISLYCIFGTYEKRNNKIFNVAYLIDRKGKIKYRYVKKHPWISEKKYTTPGKSNKAINTEFGKLAVIICWDFAFGDDLRKLARGGARVIFSPNFLVDSRGAEDVVKSTPQFRAFENLCYYVSADAFTKRTACMSFICSPFKILAKIEGKEGMIVAKLDLKKINKIRKSFDHF